MRAMFTRVALATLAVFVFAGVQTASAFVHNISVNLDGLQETPPNASPGIGSATVTFDDITGQMTVSGSFSGLLGTANNAHVHGYAAAGFPAGAIFGLTFDAATSGNFSGNGVIPGANIPDVMNHLTYINLHSTSFPGGEIRGQIIVPEPATIALAPLAGLFLLGRRRMVR